MKARFSRALSDIALWCRKARHMKLGEQHHILTLKLRGHYAYYGITGNGDTLTKLRFYAERIWKKWLGRRSQRAGMSWEKFYKLCQRYPLPPPVVVHSTFRQPAKP